MPWIVCCPITNGAVVYFSSFRCGILGLGMAFGTVDVAYGKVEDGARCGMGILAVVGAYVVVVVVVVA